VEVSILSYQGLIDCKKQVSYSGSVPKKVDPPKLSEDIVRKLSKIQKAFFLGSGLHLEAVKKAKLTPSCDIEIYPLLHHRTEPSSIRNVMQAFRDAVLALALGGSSAWTSKKPSQNEMVLHHYLRE